MHTVVERKLQASLVLSPELVVPVPARLSYRTADPYAACITFHVDSISPVTWTFARELLAAGVFRAAGEGDVRVWPGRTGGRAVVCMALSSPLGEALVTLPAAAVSGWLELTMRMVPPGAERERLDLDTSLRELLTPEAQ